MNNKYHTFTLPVGYYPFHKNQLFNFQLNRWHSLGYARFEDMDSAGKKINNFADWKWVMTDLADQSLKENRLINAAFYFRAAEFYTFDDDPDRELLYNRFTDLFYQAFNQDSIERFQVPYTSSSLPVIKVSSTAVNHRGVIVMHGGFDSFIEEFYSIMRFFAGLGYDVYAFEGPGQGRARREQGILLDYRWEKPAKALLDFFNLSDVTWLGISMGGWFCFRAAAYEPRISRVMALSIAYDYMQFPPRIFQRLGNLFFHRFRDYSNKVTLKKMDKDMMHRWMIGQLMYIADKETPMEAFDVASELNAENLHSELVKQDVLILTGKGDHLIPFKMHRMQIRALNNARSVTDRVFRKETMAHNHCCIGNVGLALETMAQWIKDKS